MAKRSDGRTRLGRFAPGTSGNPTGGKPKPRAGGFRGDDWQNFATGIGIFGRDKRVGTHFAVHQLSFDQLKDLWLGDDLAARAVETLPKEAMRQGYDISIASGQDGGPSNMDAAELATEVTAKLDLLGADDYLETAGAYERGYGGGAVLVGANDGTDDLTQPLNLAKVRSLDWLTPLEARELMPLYAYSDPRAPKYGQPEIYQLTSRSVLPSYSGNYQSATMNIHESRLLIFPGIRVSRYQVTTARGGWGEATLSRVYRVLRDFNQAWSSAGVLVSDFAQSVIKIAGLWEALATDGTGAFSNRLAAMEYGRSVVNALTIDAGDDYQRQQTPLNGLPDLLEKFAVRLAAACDMPLTLLFGTSPAGMNATGESDIRFFYDRVAAYQRRKMEPHIRRLCQIIFRTLGSKQEPDKWQVKFRPLWQESAKDKATAMLTQAQADSAWITAGVVSPEEVAASHWGKGEYDPNLTVDFEAREAQEAVAATPVDQEALNAMDPDHYAYQPPPPPGSAVPPGTVPPPGKPAAPDPNTPPKNIVQSQDSADVRRDNGAVNENVWRFDGEMDTEDLVEAQLEDEFPDDAMDWIHDAKWAGPKQVDLADIDFSNSDSWAASDEPDRVKKFQKKIAKGKIKPIILVKRPGAKKLMIADGHHRALAYKKLGQPAIAYIGTVDTKNGPWDEFHSQQARADQDRDERGRFAGGGYGNPSPAQSAARASHERMAGDHAASAAHHAKQARALHTKAEAHAKAGEWDKFAKASRESLDHQTKASHAMMKTVYHAERAGTDTAAQHVARAAQAMRHDDWSEASREAALEARKKNAQGKTPTTEQVQKSLKKAKAEREARPAPGRKAAANREPAAPDPTQQPGHIPGPAHPVPPPAKPVPSAAPKSPVAQAMAKGAAAHEASNKARESGSPEDHEKAAKAHEAAQQAFEKAGPEHHELAENHAARAAEHETAAKTAEKGETAHAPKGEHGEGKKGGEHGGKSHGEKPEHGHGAKGKGSPLKKIGETAMAAAEIIGGKTAGEVAESLKPEGGEGEKEKE